MSNAPYGFDYIAEMSGQYSPTTLHVQSSELCAYYRKYLLQKAMSVFKWNIPKTWDKDYFLYTLYTWGYLAVVNTSEYGVIPQQCSLSGYNVFYRPNKALIVNPKIRGILEPIIDKQCTILKLQPDYTSIMDIVELYAGMMSLVWETMAMNITNSKLGYVGFVGNDSEAKTFKKLYDQILSGEPAVVTDKKMKNAKGEKSWEMFNNNVGQNYIADKLLIDLKKIENMFNTDIGIKNSNTEKKERMIVSEVEANNEETESKASIWLEQLQESCTKANALFEGLNISVDWRNKQDDVSRETLEVTDNE